jgi:hypothetical protein
VASVCPKCRGVVDIDDSYCRHCGRSLRPTWSRLTRHGDEPASRRIVRRSRRRSERFRFVDADGSERVYDRLEDVPEDLRRRLGGLHTEAERLLAGGLDDVVFDEDIDDLGDFSYEVTVEDAGSGALELLENIRDCFGDLVDDSLADDA